MHGCTRIKERNPLSSGLKFEVDAHSNFGLRNGASFSKYVPRCVYNFLAHCQTAFLASSCARTVLFESVSANVGALGGCDDISVHPGITLRDGPNCSRMLMNFSAVVVFLSSRCALGDRLPLFFCKLDDSLSEHFPFAIPLLELSFFAFASVL